MIASLDELHACMVLLMEEGIGRWPRKGRFAEPFHGLGGLRQLLRSTTSVSCVPVHAVDADPGVIVYHKNWRGSW